MKKSFNDILLEKSIQKDNERIKRFGHLLEGIKGQDKKRFIARILETQAKYNARARMNEDTLTSDLAIFNKFALPLIRRIYPTLPVNDLVGIQPLTGPNGLIFTMEGVYTNNKAPITAGTTIYDNATQYYASSAVSDETFQAAGSSTTSYGGTLGWKPITAGTVVVTIGSITGTDAVTAGTIAGTGISSGTINYTTGVVAITLASGATAAGKVSYEYNSEANTQIPELEWNITSQAVVAQSRKLRAKWSPEGQQDMNYVYGVDAEAAIVAEIANSIQREISRAVVEKCRAAVPSEAKKTWTQTRPDYISYDDHKRTLVDGFILLSDIIGKATRRGKANVMVAGTDFAQVIQTLPGFIADSDEFMILPGGRIGTLNNRWVILEDIDMDATKCLLGFKGQTFLDCGVVYSPYVALMLETLVNPDDFKIRKGFMTRDAITTVNGKFYAEMSITGTKPVS